MEYVIVLGVATVIVAIGAVAFFGGFRQFADAAATALVGRDLADDGPNGHDSFRRPSQPGRRTTAGDTLRPDVAESPIPLIALAVAVGLLGIAGLAIVRRRRKAGVRESADDDAKSTESEPLKVRAFEKRQQLWRAILTDGELLLRNGMEVRHLMTRDLLTVRPSATIEEVWHMMLGSRVHHVLVCQEDRLLGIISDRDLRGRETGSARAIMQTPVISVTPGTKLGSAIHLLIEKNISCLPVLDEGRLCGILSTTDLILTLQCALQLWLRTARESGTNCSLIAEQDAASQPFEREVALQHE